MMDILLLASAHVFVISSLAFDLVEFFRDLVIVYFCHLHIALDKLWRVCENEGEKRSERGSLSDGDQLRCPEMAT
jgi:hypothetical protein